MWAPSDINALPTAEDVLNVKEAISELKRQIEIARSSPESLVKVDVLQKELEGRLAWVAPWRRVPTDILSIIFEYCNREDWKSSLMLTAVSTRWRAIVLSTPRAWSYVDTKECKNYRIVRTYLDRGGQCPLHFYYPSRRSDIPVSKIAQRLHCLSIENMYIYEIVNSDFPNLECLSLQTGTTTSRLSRITSTRFPSLRHLICGSLGSDSDSEWMPPDFPPLTTLSIAVAIDLAWLTVLQASRDTLTSLRLHLHEQFSIPAEHQVTLPRLQCLEIQNWTTVNSAWPLDLKTPILQTYVEHHRRIRDQYLHKDLATIRRMRTNVHTPVPPLPQLSLLQLEIQDDIPERLVGQLSDESLYPKLERVEVFSRTRRPNVRHLVEQMFGVRTSQPPFVVTSKRETEFPGTISKFTSREYVPCSELIPIT